MVSLKQTIPSSGEGDYIVSWKSQSSSILKGLGDLLGYDGILLTDVTLACNGDYIQAHKVVLSLCSSFFKDLFQKNRVDKSNSIVILTQVSMRDLRYLLRYMYEGKVEIPSHHVDTFLKAGNILKIDGLTSSVQQDCEQLKPVASKDPILPNSHGPSRPIIHSSSARKKVRLENSGIEQIEENSRTFGVDDENSNSVDEEYQREVEECNNEKSEARISSPVNHIHVIKTEPRSSSGERQNEENEGGSDEETTKGFNKPSSSKWWEISRVRKKPRPYRMGHGMPHRRPRSVVWNFFERAPNGTKAKCKICDTILKVPCGSTSGMLSHLKLKHPGHLKKIPLPPTYGYYEANSAAVKNHCRNDPLRQEDAGFKSKSYSGPSAISISSHKDDGYSEDNTYQPNLSTPNITTDSSSMHGILQGSYDVLNDVGSNN